MKAKSCKIDVDFPRPVDVGRETLSDPRDALSHHCGSFLHHALSMRRQCVVSVLLARCTLAHGLRSIVVAKHAKHIHVVPTTRACLCNGIQTLLVIFMITVFVVLSVEPKGDVV